MRLPQDEEDEDIDYGGWQGWSECCNQAGEGGVWDIFFRPVVGHDGR